MTEEPLAAAERPSPARPGRLLIIGLVALLTASIAYLGLNEARQEAGIRKGAMAPPFKLARYGGGTVSLEELRGKVVMLDFWATWCAPCVAEMPSLSKLAREYEGKGLVFLAVNRDEAEIAPAQVGVFIAQRASELSKSVVFGDDRMAMSYAVEALPMMYFIGRDGRVLESYMGYVSESALRRRIESALAQ